MVAQTSLSVTLLSCFYDYEMLLLSVKTHPWYICELVTEFGQDSRIGLIAICGTHLGKSCIHKESLLPQVVPFRTILSSPSHFAQSTKHRILVLFISYWVFKLQMNEKCMHVAGMLFTDYVGICSGSVEPTGNISEESSCWFWTNLQNILWS